MNDEFLPRFLLFAMGTLLGAMVVYEYPEVASGWFLACGSVCFIALGLDLVRRHTRKTEGAINARLKHPTALKKPS